MIKINYVNNTYCKNTICILKKDRIICVPIVFCFVFEARIFVIDWLIVTKIILIH